MLSGQTENRQRLSQARAGTADDIHRQLEPFVGLCDSLILTFPASGADAEETRAGHAAIIEAFGQ